MFAMFLKLRLFSLANDYAIAKLIGFNKCVEGNTYVKFITLLEGIHIVDWPFQFCNIESRCKIDCKLEGLNPILFKCICFATS